MAFCDKEKQLVNSGYTTVSNKFFINYMPDAPDVRSAVYLMGLALSDSQGSDNSVDTIAQKLNITCDDVMSAYIYWQELGLVNIENGEQPKVTYLTLRDSVSSLKKIPASKYAKFSKEIQTIIEGRMITPNEFNEYFLFLENTTFEPAALLAVAKYCVELKGNSIKYQYILTVAYNEIKQGNTTLATVADNLDNRKKYDDDLKLVFKAMSTNRKIDHADREYYDKWSKEFGFTQDVIVNVAKNCKTGGMMKLDGMLCEYYKRNAMSLKEIETYVEEKNRMFDLAKAVIKSIGVYYQSVDMVIDEYISKWLSKGYDDETLLAIAKYCFKSGIRTLNGMAAVIDKLYKNGITTLAALDDYLQVIAVKDEMICKVLTLCGLARKVTANDRQLYKTWTEIWSMPQSVIEYAAEKAAGTNAPMAYINRILSDYKQHNITTTEQAKEYKSAQAQSAATTAKANVNGKSIEKRQYTDDEISALFTALDEGEN